MFTLHPDIAITRAANVCYVEDRECRLTFHGASAALCEGVTAALPTSRSTAEMAQATGYSERSVNECLDILEKESFVLREDFLETMAADDALAKIRAAGLFWNKHVMSQPFPLRLFAGEATRAQLIGWGIEFYHFVRAAREYMARGASRIDQSTEMLSPLWDHFVDEAFHDEIFCEGLLGLGLEARAVQQRLPLASTRALLNFLWEMAEAGAIPYASIFALMQPVTERPRTESIREKYDFLRSAYPYAAPLFDAFEKHDGIDAALEHSSLTLEPLLRAGRHVDRGTMQLVFQVIRNTAEHFDMFFHGIAVHYTSQLEVEYRQRPNASALACLLHGQHGTIAQ